MLRWIAPLLALSCGTGAAAQMAVDGPPLPRVTLVDKIGIDLRSGRRADNDGGIAIGPAESPNFSYSFGAEGGSGPPLWGYVYQHCIPYNQYPCGGGSFPEFVMGTKTEWNRSGGYDTLYDGSKFYSENGGYVVYDKDGSKWTFTAIAGACCQVDSNLRRAYLTSLRFANGETLTYHYAAVPAGSRPMGAPEKPAVKSITSSAGYQLKFEDDGSGVKRVRLINRAQLYCDPLAAACPASPIPWPTVAITGEPQWGGSANFSNTRTVTYGQQVQGAQIRTTWQGHPVYEYHQTVTSGAGVSRTYTTGTLPEGGSCGSTKVVRRVATPSGTWTYNYTSGWYSMMVDQTQMTSWGCVVYTATSIAPDGSQVKREPIDGGEQITDEIGRVTKYLFRQVHWPITPYTADKREVTSITYPEGNKVTFNYGDHYGRQNLLSTTVTPKPGTLEPTLSWQWGYDTNCTAATAATCNKPLYEIDPKGNRTDFTYDPAHGGVLTKTMPADPNGVRPQIRYTYQQLSATVLNSAGQPVLEAPIWKLVSTSQCRTQANCAGTADEVVTTYTYDASLRPVTETKRAGDWSVSSTLTKSYDAVGNIVAVDGPLTGAEDTTRYRYDALRRPVAKISPDPDGPDSLPVLVERTTYNGDDQPTLVETGTAADWSDAAVASMSVNSQFATGYDSAGRKASETNIAGGVARSLVQYSYDIAGRLLCSTVRMNPAAYGSLPASACDLGPQGTDGPDRITRNIYDAAGQLLTVQKAYATNLQQAYASYTYSLNGKQLSVTDAKGNVASMSFDGLDRQTFWRFPSKTSPGAVSPDDYEQYGYDLNGNRTSLRKRDGTTITFGFDALNRISYKSAPASGSGAAGYVVHYGYELGGQMLRARFGSPSGPGVDYGYDALGRLTGSASLMGGFGRTLLNQWDAAGRRTRITHPDGTFFTYAYDLLGRLIAIRENGGTTIAAFTYDPQGRRSGVSVPGASSTYGYDGLSRLTGLSHDLAGPGADQSLTFGYNPASQLTLRTATNDSYAWMSSYNVSRDYAVNGLNQYSTAGPAAFTYDGNGNLTADGSTSFAYDAENRLVSASGSRSANLTYDSAGRLFQTSGGSNGTTQFLYDGDDLVAEFDAGGGLLRRYVHGPGTDDPLVWYEGGGLSGRRSLIADHQGSVIAVTDSAGNASTINSYDPWGIPAAGNSGRFAFTGQTLVPELGMYHYKARIYSPTLGRFLQTDPVGYKEQVNLYAYARNDPVSRSDEGGTWSRAVHDRIFSLAIGNWGTRRDFNMIVGQSVQQDIGADKANMRAHFLRNPGEDAQQARRNTASYINNQVQVGARAWAAGDREGAMRAFARAAHAQQDSHSPVHNQGGLPAEYHDRHNGLIGVIDDFRDAVDQNHTPLEGIGGEGLDDLTPELRNQMVRETQQLWSRIFSCDTHKVLRGQC